MAYRQLVSALHPLLRAALLQRQALIAALVTAVSLAAQMVVAEVALVSGLTAQHSAQVAVAQAVAVLAVAVLAAEAWQVAAMQRQDCKNAGEQGLKQVKLATTAQHRKVRR